MWTPGRREGRRTISLHRPDSDSVLPDLYTLSILLSKVTSSRGQCWERDHDYYLYNLSHFWPCYTVILLYTYISIILDWSHDIPPKSSLRGELFDSGFFSSILANLKTEENPRNSILSLCFHFISEPRSLSRIHLNVSKNSCWSTVIQWYARVTSNFIQWYAWYHMAPPKTSTKIFCNCNSKW